MKIAIKAFAAFGLAFGLMLIPAPAAAQNVDMEEQLGPAYLLSNQGDRISFVTPPEGLRGGQRAIQINTYYLENARTAGDVSVAWEDMNGVADCAARRINIADAALYAADGRQLAAYPLNTDVTINAGSAMETAFNIACTNERPQQLNPSTRRVRVTATRTVLGQHRARSQQ
ncbi:MAG: hypothetical protein NVV62_05895 [Terricaulis sp.]|nr:hypothetical protein [Terricaulis sp.]